jgi:hypothetical protein
MAMLDRLGMYMITRQGCISCKAGIMILELAGLRLRTGLRDLRIGLRVKINILIVKMTQSTKLILMVICPRWAHARQAYLDLMTAILLVKGRLWAYNFAKQWTLRILTATLIAEFISQQYAILAANVIGIIWLVTDYYLAVKNFYSAYYNLTRCYPWHRD